MEPRHYKLLAEILLVIGIIVAAIGAVLIFFFSENKIGAIFLIIGCACALVSLPTFMILTLLTSVKIMPK